MFLTFFNIDENYLHLQNTLLIFTVKVHLNKLLLCIFTYIYNQYPAFKHENHVLKVIYIISNKCPENNSNLTCTYSKQGMSYAKNDKKDNEDWYTIAGMKIC